MDEQGDVGVAGEVVHLLARWVGGHYDDRGAGVGRGREVGVVHEGDVRHVVGARREVEEAGVLEALDDLLWERGRHAHVGVAGRGFVAEGYLLLHGGCFGGAGDRGSDGDSVVRLESVAAQKSIWVVV